MLLLCVALRSLALLSHRITLLRFALTTHYKIIQHYADAQQSLALLSLKTPYNHVTIQIMATLCRRFASPNNTGTKQYKTIQALCHTVHQVTLQSQNGTWRYPTKLCKNTASNSGTMQSQYKTSLDETIQSLHLTWRDYTVTSPHLTMPYNYFTTHNFAGA